MLRATTKLYPYTTVQLKLATILGSVDIEAFKYSNTILLWNGRLDNGSSLNGIYIFDFLCFDIPPQTPFLYIKNNLF